ncbi:MAG: F0F1 ATP synthase subunit gamma [Candidatus Curtissbacteria bacterium]|nr:F0F1 ATP synthase subunit gamma [Candidatus Curtissbacteria bacterium]
MRYKKDLKTDLSRLYSLRLITGTYEDLALSKMKQIRRDVLSTRDFLDGVARIYFEAKAAYFEHLALVGDKKRREAELALVKRNGKTVVVLISGNQGLLGNVVFQSYKVYRDVASRMHCDKVILGDIGRYLAESEKPIFDFNFFAMDDYRLSDQSLGPVVRYISSYERILVVYPSFVSVLRQVPQIDDISGSSKVDQVAPRTKKFLFEPSAYDVLKFFEGQIIGTFFKEKMLDSMLARFSARTTLMDEAGQKIDILLKNSRRQEIKNKRKQENNKMLSMFAGMSLWEK